MAAQGGGEGEDEHMMALEDGGVTRSQVSHSQPRDTCSGRMRDWALRLGGIGD
jgi:hypothetical protein